MFKGDFFSISYQDFAKGDVDKTNCGSREEEKKKPRLLSVGQEK